MRNSLQEQLLKSGLVDSNKLRQSNKAKHKSVKRQGKKKPEAEADNELTQAQVQKAERDRELNRRRQEEARRKAEQAQIKQLIQANRLPKGDGELAYNFQDGQRLKRIYVTEAVQKQLVNGRAAIVKLHGQYDIVPADAAEKIRARDAACIVLLNEPEARKDGDDPYAGYEVPDDLMW